MLWVLPRASLGVCNRWILTIWGNQGRLPGGSSTYFETWRSLVRRGGKGTGRDWSTKTTDKGTSEYKKLLGYLKNWKKSRYVDYHVFLNECLVILAKGKVRWIPRISYWLQKNSSGSLAVTKSFTGQTSSSIKRCSGRGLWEGPRRVGSVQPENPSRTVHECRMANRGSLTDCPSKSKVGVLVRARLGQAAVTS